MSGLGVCLLLLVAAASTVAQVQYKVKFDDGQVRAMAPEDYVAAVVAGEAGSLQSAEARKAMAVAARTYAARLRGRHAGARFDFCATTHCQRMEQHTVSAAAREASSATAGEILWFRGRVAFTAYSQDCGGRTEAVSAVWPDIEASYLRVLDDPYCTRRGQAAWEWQTSPIVLLRALTANGLHAPLDLQSVAVVRRTSSGRATILRLSGATDSFLVSASSVRFAVGRTLGWNLLRSEAYDIDASGLLFRGHGQGHGVGLCQHGAEEMAAEQYDYREILSFYYPGTKLGRTAAGIEWTRLNGEGITLLTVDPDRDHLAVSLADRARVWCERRLRSSFTRVPEIRVYQDTATFCDATGEPGWVAAHATANRIDLQPPACNERTLRHELLHVWITQHAVPGLPIWFREGVVSYLNEERIGLEGPVDDLRSRNEEDRARPGYAAAARRVRDAVQRYGEATVLGWIGRGLPPDVQNANASNPATNSK